MPNFLFTPSPNKDAVRFLKDKAPVAREVFDQLLPELRGLAFTITGVENMAILKKARERLAALPAGGDWDAIKQGLAADLVPYLGEEGGAKRAELLLRVHGYAAYSAAQYQVMDRQRDVFPYWQYQAAGDEHVRASHAALDGLVFPANSEFWKTHFPPWEFGCRCQVVPLSEDDVEEIRAEDAKKVPEARRVVEGDRLSLAEKQGMLITTRGGAGGVPAQIDVRSPRERSGGSGFYHNPGDLHVDLDALRASYSKTPEGAAAFGTFEQWARNTKLGPGRGTVWAWLSPQPRATPGAPRPAPDPGAGEIPSDPAFFARLRTVRRLGGSTGAMLVEDPQTGRRYVLKAGASPEHLLEEDRADAAYRALGQSVPPSVIGQRDGRPVKVAEFIEGKTLRDYLASATPTERQAVLARLESGFAADALLGNWDVIGLAQDNIVVSADGTPWRIDNGGSLRFRAQGARKTDAEWHAFPQELWTLRDAQKNPATASVFGSLDFYRIAAQIERIPEAELLAAIGDELAPTVRARLEHMRDLSRKAREFERADFAARHADGVARHMLGLRQAGVFDRIAPSLVQRGTGDVTLYDSAGRAFDNLRSQRGATSDPSQGFFDAIVPAAKSVNAHHAKGDTAYNQAKIQAALAQKPQLAALLKTGTDEQKAMADHYLQAIVAIEAAQGKPGATVPHLSKFALSAGDQASVISRAAGYLKTQGSDWQIIADWAAEQAHSSRSTLSMAVKQWYLERLPGAKATDFHAPPSSAHLAAMRKKYGAEKVDIAFETLHALTQEVLARVEAPGNDTARRLVRLLRTETTATAVEQSLKPGEVGEYKRGVNESFSTITNFAGGSGAVTVSAMPHARVTALYWFERQPGKGGGFFLGDSENEFTAIGWKVPVKYLGRNKRTNPAPGLRREDWEI